MALNTLHMFVSCLFQKSRIRETKHLSTDAVSSTDTTVGWTKNTQKPKTPKPQNPIRILLGFYN